MHDIVQGLLQDQLRAVVWQQCRPGGAVPERPIRAPPIDEQLAQHKVRAIELDAWPDPDGGRFKCNAIRRFFRIGNYVDSDPAMSQPGFKVRLSVFKCTPLLHAP
ncbi:MAG: hypothetical protein HC767_05260 [Akkermansiaceae bacterium]|nr:hypothetical protein [Akkermansiaceae bacterium]